MRHTVGWVWLGGRLHKPALWKTIKTARAERVPRWKAHLNATSPAQVQDMSQHLVPHLRKEPGRQRLRRLVLVVLIQLWDLGKHPEHDGTHSHAEADEVAVTAEQSGRQAGRLSRCWWAAAVHALSDICRYASVRCSLRSAHSYTQSPKT